MTNKELIGKVNNAFDLERAIRGLSNDEELAKALGIAPKTLSFLRNGKWTKSGTILVSIITNRYEFLLQKHQQ